MSIKKKKLWNVLSTVITITIKYNNYKDFYNIN